MGRDESTGTDQYIQKKIISTFRGLVVQKNQKLQGESFTGSQTKLTCSEEASLQVKSII